MASATTNSSDNNRKTQSNKEDHSTSTIPDLAGLTDGAIASIEAEKRMGILESFRLYPKAVAWSIVLSAAIVMDGYDTMLFGNLLAFPTFQKQFGRPVGDETYQITAVWQLSLSNSTNVGGILGLFLTGIISEKFGYCRIMIGALSLFVCFIAILFAADNIQTFFTAEILCGFPWRVF